MSGNTTFQRYIPEAHPDTLAPADKIRRHILCSGQVYYQLLQEREARGITDIAISRVEQISPVPYDLITPHLDKYPNAELMWAQEEPLNNGAWGYLQPRLQLAAEQTKHHKGREILYAGRKPSSSVATGSKQLVKFFNSRVVERLLTSSAHKAEVEAINEAAFGPKA